jgi:dUTP pyrophosphatase
MAQLTPAPFKLVSKGSIMPSRATAAAAGYDLYACEPAIIVGGLGNTIVRTGVHAVIPQGHYGRVAMRSGLAAREHLAVSAGVIDEDYPGEIGVIVYCTEIDRVVRISAGDRFAQIIFERIWTPESTDGPQRTGGFGSTGM